MAGFLRRWRPHLANPFPPIADQLEQASHALDLLIRDARLPARDHADRHAELEERAQAIAASIVASFRGMQQPGARPLSFEANDQGARAWF